MNRQPTTLQQFDGVRVLLVEDELVNQVVCQKVLQRMGIEVVVVDDGQQAVDILHEQRFDLVLMDCQMPVMDGYAATRSIRADEVARGLPRLPIIAFTAHAMRGDRETCVTAGMDDYISKPFEIATMQSVLRQWLPDHA